MSAQIIDGATIASRIREETKIKAEALAKQGFPVHLDTILVGESDGAIIYAESQAKRCRKVGIEHRLHTLDDSTTNDELQGFIKDLSNDQNVTGIILNLPLPDHLDTPAAQYVIDPYKDVEGVNPANIGMMFYGEPIIAPCTALAVMTILKEIDTQIRGKNITVIGQGDIVGKPIALALMGEEATVLACNKYTPDTLRRTQIADVVIAAAGVPELVRGAHIKPGAIVIDVGINRVAGDPRAGTASRVVGDVCFEEVAGVASAITPVPGGVGPVTVAILLQSTVEAAMKQRQHRRIH